MEGKSLVTHSTAWLPQAWTLPTGLCWDDPGQWTLLTLTLLILASVWKENTLAAWLRNIKY